MIIGVSHLTLSCANVDADSAKLREKGFELVFLEKDAPNNEGKKKFLNFYQKGHSLALLTKDRGIPIELIDHGSEPKEGPSNYEVHWTGNLDQWSLNHEEDEKLARIWKDSGISKNSILGVWSHLKIPFWWEKDSDSSKMIIRSLLIRTDRFEESRDFWEKGLGFKMDTQSNSGKQGKWLRLKFYAPISSWSTEMVLVDQKKEIAPVKLDNSGFSCLAFITTQLEKDRDRLFEAGAKDSTCPFKIGINNKKLLVEVFQGPGNEFVELVEVGK
ncbi:hypothetical protein BVX98_04270 [bacterium F11]|nr:hypothetical protein BVX98_04270 [bacterium F11]